MTVIEEWVRKAEGDYLTATRESELAHTAEPTWSWPIADVRLLTRASAAFRYPGETAGEAEAAAAMAACSPMRTRLLLLLNLSPTG